MSELGTTTSRSFICAAGVFKCSCYSVLHVQLELQLLCSLKSQPFIRVNLPRARYFGHVLMELFSSSFRNNKGDFSLLKSSTAMDFYLSHHSLSLFLIFSTSVALLLLLRMTFTAFHVVSISLPISVNTVFKSLFSCSQFIIVFK